MKKCVATTIIKLLESFQQQEAVLNYSKEFRFSILYDGSEMFGYRCNKVPNNFMDMDKTTGYISGSIHGMNGIADNEPVLCKVVKSGDYDYAIRFYNEKAGLNIGILNRGSFYEAMIISDSLSYRFY